ncbi:MAG: hypothetical protein DMF83_16345 [Acidobacteria bacterium]|nr:MAG: hypothetical protein DMF83_16345 [Acidobacteriota bacterium]
MKAKPVTRRSVLSALPLGGAVMATLAARSTAAAERQPAMALALEALKKAEASLELASADKGGHRVKAMKLTRAAMREVVLGIEYDNRH